MKFEDIKESYKVSAIPSKIDTLRILRECRVEENSQYVIVVGSDRCLLFMSKKFANRIKAINLFSFVEINEDRLYGISPGVIGNKIRSVGFTGTKVFPFEDYNHIVDSLKNIEKIEKDAALKAAKEKENYATVKVVCG